MAKFPTVALDALIIDDEESFSHVGLYADLRRIVAESDHRFMILRGRARRASWDRAAFLNLTFWHAGAGVDVLVDEHLPADVVAHVAWHHLAAKQLCAPGERPSVPALLLSESIASAFDLYLVGRLLGHRPDAEFLQTQVPAMAESAESAGMSDADFEAMLGGVAEDPERAFEDLRALLFDAATALYGCSEAAGAAEALEALEERRFAEILHHYELSNWVLYCRAYGAEAGTEDPARALDPVLRSAPVALDWLEAHWVGPAIDRLLPAQPPRRKRPR
ncbi:MAG: hypothetical protein R3B70_23540 [Polyangiaceae bacterium]